MMPLCDSHGIVPTWQEPADDVVRAFFDTLEEVPVRADEQKSLTRDTTDEELEFMGEEEPTGSKAEPSKAGEEEAEPSENLPQAEPPAPPRRRLRRAGDAAGR